jgi:hypothetical protein
MFDFAFKVIDGKKEFARCEGRAKAASPSLWEVALDNGVTHFGGVQLDMTRCVIDSALKTLSFEMKPTFPCQHLYSYAALVQNAGFLSPHVSLKDLRELPLGGSVQMQLSTEGQGLIFHAHSNTLTLRGVPLTPFRLDGQKKKGEWRIEKLEMGALSLKGTFFSNLEGFVLPQFEGSWKGASMRGKGHVLTDQKRFVCTLDSLEGNLAFVSPALSQGTFVARTAFVADYSGVDDPFQIEGEANLFVDFPAPLPIILNNKKTVKFTYAASKGLCCRGVDLQCKHSLNYVDLATVKAETLRYAQDSDFSIEQMQFSFSQAMLDYCIDAHLLPSSLTKLEWKGDLEGSGDLQCTETGACLLGSLRPGHYGFDGKQLQFEQLQLRYEKNILNLRAKALVEGEPLWSSLQVSLTKEPQGMLKLFDHPKAEGLKLLFLTRQGKVVVESVQGSCYGLSCSLVKSPARKIPFATVLSGEVTLDGNTLSSLLPKDVREGIQRVQLGSGYRWQGDLVLWEDAHKGFLLQGLLSGKEFEALGYRFHKLEGTIEANPTQVIFSHMKMEDSSGVMAIKRIELKKEEGWHFQIPEILVQHVRPSLMRKVDSALLEAKPFMIKNCVLEDIHGKLGDIASLEGSGHLQFVNQFKKEASIWDIPLEMVKKIGLDLGLLTPVQGEIHMELRGDKFYLVSLDNSFSEGGRAAFYLPMEKGLSYIDLDGKVHIDLKMRQDVVLKVTEPFTLTIRGTLDKLRYGLQF